MASTGQLLQHGRFYTSRAAHCCLWLLLDSFFNTVGSTSAELHIAVYGFNCTASSTQYQQSCSLSSMTSTGQLLLHDRFLQVSSFPNITSRVLYWCLWLCLDSFNNKASTKQSQLWTKFYFQNGKFKVSDKNDYCVSFQQISWIIYVTDET